MKVKPTYEELEKKVTELEEKLSSLTKNIGNSYAKESVVCAIEEPELLFSELVDIPTIQDLMDLYAKSTNTYSFFV